MIVARNKIQDSTKNQPLILTNVRVHCSLNQLNIVRYNVTM